MILKVNKIFNKNLKYFKDIIQINFFMFSLPTIEYVPSVLSCPVKTVEKIIKDSSSKKKNLSVKYIVLIGQRTELLYCLSGHTKHGHNLLS